MSKDYRLNVSEFSYEDDWEQGEIGTGQFVDLTDHHQYFDSPEEALKAFADEYGNGNGKMYKLDNGDGRVSFGFSASKKSGNYGWEDLTKYDEEAWKAGKLKVYNVEWVAQIIHEEQVNKVNENALPFPIEEA